MRSQGQVRFIMITSRMQMLRSVVRLTCSAAGAIDGRDGDQRSTSRPPSAFRCSSAKPKWPRRKAASAAYRDDVNDVHRCAAAAHAIPRGHEARCCRPTSRRRDGVRQQRRSRRRRSSKSQRRDARSRGAGADRGAPTGPGRAADPLRRPPRGARRRRRSASSGSIPRAMLAAARTAPRAAARDGSRPRADGSLDPRLPAARPQPGADGRARARADRAFPRSCPADYPDDLLGLRLPQRSVHRRARRSTPGSTSAATSARRSMPRPRARLASCGPKTGLRQRGRNQSWKRSC